MNDKPTMWSVDPNIETARKAKGWKEFHRRTGQANFYIDAIAKEGRGYKATAFQLKDRFRGPYIQFPLPTGKGKTPIDACVDAYRAAIVDGKVKDEGLEKLFLPDDDDEEDLIG